MKRIVKKGLFFLVCVCTDLSFKGFPLFTSLSVRLIDTFTKSVLELNY